MVYLESSGKSIAEINKLMDVPESSIKPSSQKEDNISIGNGNTNSNVNIGTNNSKISDNTNYKTDSSVNIPLFEQIKKATIKCVLEVLHLNYNI
jgi:hypothetical protein